ncbi:MAG: RNA-binding domain-containing protein [Nitrolancea sp.]
MDLHIHTPASADYQQREVSFVQLLQRAEERGIDILAFTDHNSVRGYARMWREIEDLELLEALNRIQPDEARLLNEYRRLLNRILLLPGFEFTATFGFHILAIFPEDTSIRKLEHTLLSLHIPDDKIDMGTSEVGATTDVLQAFELMHEAGAIVIGAHVNSTHGIAMQGFPFGGQTKIAYTQSPNLHALEATDLENAGPRTTARFFNGSKPEYPRRMFCIQGSDAHRLVRESEKSKDLGLGDRITEILLPQVSFAAIKAVFASNDFNKVRPYQATESKLAQVLSAREEGDSQTQVFHERLSKSRRRTNAIFKDVVALANTDGGDVFVGLSATHNAEVVGVPRIKTAMEQIKEDVERFITPAPPVTIEMLNAHDRDLLVVTIGSGGEKPYALTSGEIYVRDGSNTSIATRDQIVNMVRDSISPSTQSEKPRQAAPQPKQSPKSEASSPNGKTPALVAGPTPRTGVEIVSSAQKEGVVYHTMRDLRNQKIVENVTHESARRLWRYAIKQRESGEPTSDEIKWVGDFGVVRLQKQRNGSFRYDLAYRQNGDVRVFYGVTDVGMPEDWKSAVENATEKANAGD